MSGLLKYPFWVLTFYILHLYYLVELTGLNLVFVLLKYFQSYKIVYILLFYLIEIRFISIHYRYSFT